MNGALTAFKPSKELADISSIVSRKVLTINAKLVISKAIKSHSVPSPSEEKRRKAQTNAGYYVRMLQNNEYT